MKVAKPHFFELRTYEWPFRHWMCLPTHTKWPWEAMNSSTYAQLRLFVHSQKSYFTEWRDSSLFPLFCILSSTINPSAWAGELLWTWTMSDWLPLTRVNKKKILSPSLVLFDDNHYLHNSPTTLHDTKGQRERDEEEVIHVHMSNWYSNCVIIKSIMDTHEWIYWFDIILTKVNLAYQNG